MKLLFAILLLAVGAISWLTYDTIRPHPLGDQMQYLGKENHGNILGFDSKPYSVYYYGTDMDSGAIKSYFNASPETLDSVAI